MQHQSDVQSLGRGLRILEVVSGRPGSSTSEIALACELPRTTTHRLLVTLAQNGFIRRDEWTQRYLPTSRVLRLAGGFDVTARLTETVKLLLDELATEIEWPVHFAVREGHAMRLTVSTDLNNPLAVHKLRPGVTIPLLQCAAGLVCLAGRPEEERNQLVDEVLPLPGEVRWTRSELHRELVKARKCGYAVFRRAQRFSAMVDVAVPARIDGELEAAMTVRFAERALVVSRACDRFLPLLSAAANRLSAMSFRTAAAQA